MPSESKSYDALCIDDRRIRRADCAHCAIRKQMLFADIDVAAAGMLLAPVTNIRYEQGDMIYYQGDASDALFSLRSGIVKLSVASDDGDLRIVRLLGPGAVVGLECLLKQTYHTIAECLSAVDMCRIPARSVREIAREQPQLYLSLMQQWQEHVEMADTHIVNLSTGPINERVINLLRLINGICNRGGTPFILPTNQDCAALVAARVESVSRVMAELKRAGILDLSEAGEWRLRFAVRE